MRGTRKCLHALQHAIEIRCHHNEYDNRPTPFAVALINLTAFSLRSRQSCQTFKRLFVKIKKCFPPQWQNDANFYSLYTLWSFWTYQMTTIRTKAFHGLLWRRPGLQKNRTHFVRHSNVQSNTSDTATVPTSGTFTFDSHFPFEINVSRIFEQGFIQ